MDALVVEERIGKRIPNRDQRRDIRMRGQWRSGRGERVDGLRFIALSEQFLHAAHRIAFLVEQAIDTACKRDVGRPIVTAVAGAL